MLAIVIIVLVVSLLVVVIVTVSAILRVAFGNPNELRKQNEEKEKEIDSALATLHDVKINAQDPLSHTYGELFGQEPVGKLKL